MRLRGSILVLSLVISAVIAIALPVSAGEMSETFQAEAVENTEGFCSVTCWNGSVISCVATTCTAINSDCPLSRGRIVCDGKVTYCPYCPPGDCPMDGEECVTSTMCRGSVEPPCAECFCYFPAPYPKSTEYIPPGGEEGICVCP